MRALDAPSVSEPGSTGTDLRVHYAINFANLPCDFFELTGVEGGDTLRRIPVRAGDILMGYRIYATPVGVAGDRGWTGRPPGGPAGAGRLPAPG